MNRILLYCLMVLFCVTGLYAQDIILKINGDEIRAKVTEIGINDVKYNRFDNLTGPIYTLSKSEIFKITYEDGSHDIFGKAIANPSVTPSVTSYSQPVDQTISNSTSQSTAYTHASSDKYRRSSLYSLLIKHPDKEFANDIEEVFKSIPIPEKFNNHDLKFKVVNAMSPREDTAKDLQQLDNTQSFIVTNDIGRRLVAKWFDYDSKTGTFDLGLIFDRGLYDASFSDIKTALATTRGYNMLKDAGIELIGNTYIIFNDIQYVNKEDRAAVVGFVLGMTGEIAGGVAGVTSGKTSAVSSLVSATSNLGAAISDQIAGFSVEVTSYLYRLNWNDEISGTFYQNYYVDRKNPSVTKRNAFNQDKGTFTMSFVGVQTVQSGKTSLKGVSTNGEMIRKVCTRAIDKSIAKLQQKYDEFKVKTPLYSINPLFAKIGVKEGIDENTKFEVLEKMEDENGRTSYKRVGTIKPVKGKIWDNRYLATEEGFENANLSATEFTKVSGGDFYPGMLVREMK